MTEAFEEEEEEEEEEEGFALFCLCFSVCKNLSEKKKREKPRDNNTPAQHHHRRRCIHYINIFTTKRKESTDNKNNKNKNKNNTLNCSNATSVTFRNSVVVFFSKRVVQLQRQKREQF
jgi:hypothetical protein